ncbi:MAG: hypothetical protein CMI56_02010 [Parcubacteria group bacterium]|jgi:hypothetical protein|nr:hypothetical protein [Parcubacteria group bacterium]|tara:strand:- start:4261 stop:4659 length:399 start_codon:yes stop_codon:yes gene_type:complete
MDMEKTGRVLWMFSIASNVGKVLLYSLAFTTIAYYITRDFVVRDVGILAAFCLFYALVSVLGAVLAITGTREQVRDAAQVILSIFVAGLAYQAVLWYSSGSIGTVGDSMIPFSLVAAGFLVPVLSTLITKSN